MTAPNSDARKLTPAEIAERAARREGLTHDEIIRCYAGELHEEKEQELTHEPDDFRAKRFVLVERGIDAYGGGVWLTSHASPQDAADYHDHQEFREDWVVEVLYDTKTGRELGPTTRTTFEP